MGSGSGTLRFKLRVRVLRRIESSLLETAELASAGVGLLPLAFDLTFAFRGVESVGLVGEALALALVQAIRGEVDSGFAGVRLTPVSAVRGEMVTDRLAGVAATPAVAAPITPVARGEIATGPVKAAPVVGGGAVAAVVGGRPTVDGASVPETPAVPMLIPPSGVVAVDDIAVVSLALADSVRRK